MASIGDAILHFKGDSKQLDNELGKVESKTTSKLSSLGKSIGGAFLKGAAVAGGALTGLVGASVKAYADMEQNLGGVETLFKDSADKVIANSKRAYETAGMSANEYMETVTGFSASLLQGLGGDTEKAAAIADTAIQDMSDNANKMGTSMELIQNAYQGFAKQNYTMLDNLKLGYGGTQSEMARLINDSGVLGDTMTVTAETVNKVSFDKIIEAIHKIQDNMGITGTTSKEAASTITGSLNSAKSAFENFISGAGEISTVVDTFTTAGKNILNAVVEMAPQVMIGIVDLINGLIPQIPTFLNALLPPLIQGVVGLIQGLVAALNALLPPLIQGVVGLIQGLVAALPQILTVLAQMLPTIITTLINGIIQIANSLATQLPTIIPIVINAILDGLLKILDNIPLLINAGVQLLVGLANGLVTAIPQLIDRLPEIIEALINALIAYIPTIITVAPTLMLKLGWALVKAIPQLVSKIPEIIVAMVKGFKNGISDFVDIGGNLVKGLWQGISDKVDWVVDKIKGFGKSILNGIKSFFGIHSPSTEFAWIGKMNVIGLNEGMEDMKGTVENTFDDLFDLSPQVKASAATYFSPQTNVVVNNQFETDPLGQVVNRIKSVSGGARSDYNVGMGANA